MLQTLYGRYRKWRVFYVIPSESFSGRLSVRQRFYHLCPLNNSDTVRDIFTKFHKNIKHYKTTSRTYEP